VLAILRPAGCRATFATVGYSLAGSVVFPSHVLGFLRLISRIAFRGSGALIAPGSCATGTLLSVSVFIIIAHTSSSSCLIRSSGSRVFNTHGTVRLSSLPSTPGRDRVRVWGLDGRQSSFAHALLPKRSLHRLLGTGVGPRGRQFASLMPYSRSGLDSYGPGDQWHSFVVDFASSVRGVPRY